MVKSIQYYNNIAIGRHPVFSLALVVSGLNFVALRLTLSVILTLAAFATPPGERPAHGASTGDGAVTPTSISKSAYVARGDQVESRYRAYRERLERFHDLLSERVKEFGLDLLPKLQAAAPKPIPHGYQILPKFAPDVAVPSKKPRATSTGFSWPRTDQLIDQGAKALTGLERQLEEIPARPGQERRAAYEKLIDDFRRLSDGRKLIDSNVQYNRLWQFNIATYRAEYDRQTRLHNAVLERQAISDALDVREDAAFYAALSGIKGIDATKERDLLESDLREHEKSLATEIDGTAGVLSTPDFVRVDHQQSNLWIIRVPFYTDIEDFEFLRLFEDAVERTWRLRDGEDEFKVEISFTTLSPTRLYGQGKTLSKPGDRIDVSEHIALFPTDGATLTTGAVTTHVLGRAIVVGPHDIAPHVLAHEFGHILGFRDFYFRGYKDLGSDGYLVKEAIADPNDIMGAPGYGPVLRRHFERVIEKLSARDGR
jgi:hypothetical protein